MNEKNRLNRRQFLKSVGAAGIGSAITAANVNAEEQTEKKAETNEMPKVPKRKLGKTNVEVPVLALGCMFNTIENQMILKKALDWGVSYFDTADCYMGGNSEVGIGNFIKKNPDLRKDIFIVTKSDKRDIAGIQELLNQSLKKMNTDYIDLYYIHGLNGPNELNDDIKNWAAKAKKEGKIKLFGFSTHKNMAKCLAAAAKLDYIDAIMSSYNFQLMQDAEMQTAVEACHKKGIGLVAMKVQASGQKLQSEQDKKLTSHFIQKGFTEGQAKLKAVLADERFSSACMAMRDITMLMTNVAAVLDKTKLTDADMKVFKQYAIDNCDGYCKGCAEICDQALPHAPYVSDIMRYLMYYNNYDGDQQVARQLFNEKIPLNVRKNLLKNDYSLAQAKCPQNLPIAKLMAQAVQKLA